MGMCSVPVDELGVTPEWNSFTALLPFCARIEEMAGRKIRKEMDRKIEIWLLRFIFCH
jgi:hypothetical protein